MKRRYQVLLASSALLTCLVLVGPAATRAFRATQNPPAAPTEVPGQSNLVYSIDPETGELGVRGNTQLSEAELNAVSTSDEGLVEVHHADGSVSIDLQGRFQSLSMAKVDARGQVHLYCVDSPEKATTVLNSPATAQPEEK